MKNFNMEEINKKINNDKKFCKLNQDFEKKYWWLNLSSNSGTGKTTYFKWNWLRKAVKGQFKFDVLFRFETEVDTKFNKSKWLKLPKYPSKRKQKLFEKLDFERVKGSEGDELYLIVKATGERIARALCVNTQSKIKSTESDIFTQRAFFDEIMPDDNRYCPDECYKLCRLIDTRARGFKYKVLGLYNNTMPYFPLKEYLKRTKAKFIDFVGEKYGFDEFAGIQEILAESDYGEVYVNNSYKFYQEFYKDCNVKDCKTIFYLSILNRVFAVKEVEDYFVLVPKNKIKKNREIFALSMQSNDYLLIEQSSPTIQFLTRVLGARKLFVNRKKNTIYIKELADYLNLSYNI